MTVESEQKNPQKELEMPVDPSTLESGVALDDPTEGYSLQNNPPMNAQKEWEFLVDPSFQTPNVIPNSALESGVALSGFFVLGFVLGAIIVQWVKKTQGQQFPPPGPWRGVLSPHTPRDQEQEALQPPLCKMHWRVFKDIISTIGIKRAETGGCAGSYNESDEISEYYFEKSSRNSPISYYPNAEELNNLLQKKWIKNGISLTSFIHSHPDGNLVPSSTDEEYAYKIISHNRNSGMNGRMWLPIINTIPDTGGSFWLTPWLLSLDGQGMIHVEKGKLKLIGTPKKYKSVRLMIEKDYYLDEAMLVTLDIHPQWN